MTTSPPIFRLIAAQPPASEPADFDAEQQLVLRHDCGVLRVVGGPGTGKTSLVVAAMAERVRRGVPLTQLLAFTFSPAAAVQLRHRISRLVGSVAAEPVARTVHSYAFGVLRQAAVRAGAARPRLLAAVERDVILREILAGRSEEGRDTWPADLAAARGTRAFVQELQDLLMRAAERNISAPELAAAGRRHRRPEWVQAASVYREYLQITALQLPGAFDAPELVQRAISALQNDPGLLAGERARRRRIFVDEYSDLDEVQLDLIQLISRGADELVVTGDPDQSVFTFRGSDGYALADLSDRLDLSDRHQDGSDQVQTVLLRTGYRACAQLVEAAEAILVRLPGSVAHRRGLPSPEGVMGTGGVTSAPVGGVTSAPVGGVTDQDRRVSVAVLQSPAAEAAHIARAMRSAHLDRGIAWSEMAVLFRSAGSRPEVLGRQFALAGVPVASTLGVSLAQEPIVMLLAQLLRCLVQPDSLSDEDAAALLCSAAVSADPLAVQSLRRRLARAGQPAGTLAALLAEPGFVAVAGPLFGAAAERFAAVMGAGRAALSGSVSDVLWALWSAAELGARLEARSFAGGPDGARADRECDAALELFQAAAALDQRSPRADAAALLSWLQKAGTVEGGAGEPAPRRRDGQTDGVQLLSAHAAKGRQWRLVCVVGVQEGEWPNTRQRGSLLGSQDLVDLSSGRPIDTMDRTRQLQAEERRLFYLALTRASEQLVVTAVANDELAASTLLDELDPLPGPRPVLASQRPLTLTGLVSELRAVVMATPSDSADHADAIAELSRLAEAGVAGAHPNEWWGLADASTDSPVRRPEDELAISPSHLQAYLDCQMRALLTDLHASDGRDVQTAAVGSLIHSIAEQVDDDVDLLTLEAIADVRWSELEFQAQWHSRSERARADRMLHRLAEWLQSRQDRLTLLAKEKPFSIVIGDVRLSGRIDRLERNADGKLVVVDLKATKTQPKRDQVRDHAQLAVYQMAVQAGQFDEGAESGGGLLVQLGSRTKKSPALSQPPLTEHDDPDRLTRELARLSADLRQPSVWATPGEGCELCPVRMCCPIQDDGRQV